MDTNLNSNINLFPNPPTYYKNFTKEDYMLPPDLNILTRLDSFMTFGTDYKMKEINYSTLPVETGFLRAYEPGLIESKNIPNRKLFEDPNIELNKMNMDNLNINIIDSIESEIKFIKKTYTEMLDQLTNIVDFELNSCLIKYSYQKIYFFISLLKKKKILIEMITYFRKEIDNNSDIDNNLSKNLENCQSTLTTGLKKIKDDMSNNILK